MKRDMDLVRTILLTVEEKGPPRGFMQLDLPGYDPETVSHHVLLLGEAGLLEVLNRKLLNYFEVMPKCLTWAGHEFLDAARNDTVWNKAKEVVKEKGGAIPFEVLKVLLTKLASSVFGVG